MINVVGLSMSMPSGWTDRSLSKFITSLPRTLQPRQRCLEAVVVGGAVSVAAMVALVAVVVVAVVVAANVLFAVIVVVVVGVAITVAAVINMNI